MRAIVGILLVLAGCQVENPFDKPTPVSNEMFAAASVRIHPIFTGIKDWTGDGQPDGIEAELEFVDQFGDPTKAAGRVVFELYSYRQNNPDPKGTRLANPWIGSISTVEEQKARWNRTSRTYSFELKFPGIPRDQTYVLIASFEPIGGGDRFFDRTILQSDSEDNGPRERPRPPRSNTSKEPDVVAPTTTTTLPVTQPSERTPEP